MAAAAGARQQQPFCHACYGTSLTYEHGVLVCDACGAQTQTFQEEAEWQYGIDDARGRRRAAGSTVAAAPTQAQQIAAAERAGELLLAQAGDAYARCLQALLQAQGAALTARFGVSPQAGGLLRQLWLALLPSTGLLEQQPHRLGAARGYLWLGRGSGAAAARAAAAAAAAGSAAGFDSGETDDEEDDGEPDAAERQQHVEQQQQQQAQAQTQQQQEGQPVAAPMRAADAAQPANLKLLLWRLMHPQVTLQLCFVACLLLREAVTHFDVMRWALDGQLPFLEMPSLCRQLRGAPLDVLPLRVLQPLLTVTPSRFCAGACRIAQHLGLELPPVPGEPLLLRAVKELSLPLVVYEAALQLHALYLLGTPALRISAASSRSRGGPGAQQPYTWLAALLLVAVKLLYGLGAAQGQLPLAAKAPGPPDGWQGWAQRTLQRLPGVSSLPLTEQEALALSPTELSSYLRFCREAMFAGQPVVSTLEDLQRLLAGWYEASAAPPDAAAGGGGSGTAGAAAAVDGAAVPALPPRMSPAPAAAAAAAAPAAAATAVANYSLTVGFKAMHGTARLEPSLACVVVVLAAYGQASPSNLLSCTRKLEQQMVAVESAIKAAGRQGIASRGTDADAAAAAAASSSGSSGSDDDGSGDAGGSHDMAVDEDA